jgi:5'-phosphate synthase pdxT subunit
MRIGVTSLQGAVSEHVAAFEAAFSAIGTSGSVVQVRSQEDLKKVHALAIPGGESTTISKLLLKTGLYDGIIGRAEEGMPVLGTCAGCILLAKEGDFQVDSTETKLLGLMDMCVSRNAFGRQRESFEAQVKIEGLQGGGFHAVFIRAPAIEDVWGKCKPLAKVEGLIVAARQDNLLGLAFHPELSRDTRLHEMFISMV